MPEAKRPDPKRRSPTSRPQKPGKAGESGRGRPRSASPARREPRAKEKDSRPEAEPKDSAESIRQSIAVSAEQQSEQRFGSAARRAAILAAVVCVLTLTIAGPVRTYFGQRTEMKQLKATEEQLRAQISELEQQKVKLADPVFVAAQARERLGFVMPGEIPYQVQLPADAAVPGTPGAEPAAAESRPAVVHRAVAHHRRCAAWRCYPPPRPARLRCHPLSRRLPLRPVHPLPVADRSDLDAVERQLGREPRGVIEIAYRCPNGEPAVVKTTPRLPDGTPFPTLYYLTHPALTAAASRLESSGLMREMTERLGQDAALAEAYQPGARVVSRRTRCDRAFGHNVFRWRNARSGQVPACVDRAFAGQGPRSESPG